MSDKLLLNKRHQPSALQPIPITQLSKISHYSLWTTTAKQPATMKLSITMISILLTSALGASIKRQNDIPDCVKGDTSTIDMPGKFLSYH